MQQQSMTVQRKPTEAVTAIATTPARTAQPGDIRAGMARLLDEVAKVIVGKRDVLELVAIATLTEGAHILFEDMPGLAKSVMAATFARASGTTFKRIQFTP